MDYFIPYARASSFSNDIGTSFLADPYLMHFVRIDVPSSTYAQRFLLRVRIVRVCIGQRAVENEMCGYATMLVWQVMGVAIASQLMMRIAGMI